MGRSPCSGSKLLILTEYRRFFLALFCLFFFRSNISIATQQQLIPPLSRSSSSFGPTDQKQSIITGSYLALAAALSSSSRNSFARSNFVFVCPPAILRTDRNLSQTSLWRLGCHTQMRKTVEGAVRGCGEISYTCRDHR